jgi:acyl-CoA thioester hydrolase
MRPIVQASQSDTRLATHRTAIQVRLGDTDSLGHIHNASYAHYAEIARFDFLLQFGELANSLILAHLAIDFRREIVFGEAVHVETRVERLGRTSVTLQQNIVAGDQLAAEVRSVVVLFDYDRRSPQTLSATLREQLTPYLP